MIMEAMYLNEIQISAEFIKFLEECISSYEDCERVVIVDKGLIYECSFYCGDLLLSKDKYHKQDSSV